MGDAKKRRRFIDGMAAMIGKPWHKSDVAGAAGFFLIANQKMHLPSRTIVHCSSSSWLCGLPGLPACLVRTAAWLNSPAAFQRMDSAADSSWLLLNSSTVKNGNGTPPEQVPIIESIVSQ